MTLEHNSFYLNECVYCTGVIKRILKNVFFKEHQILYEDIYVNPHSMLLFHCIFDLYL